MRRFAYNDPAFPGAPVVVLEQEILETYYQWWSEGMAKVGKSDLISPDACIEDWLVVHWGWEVD